MNRHTLKFSIVIVSALIAIAAYPVYGKQILNFNHLRVDIARRRISFDANVCLRKGQLELLVCKTSSKEHESILHTDAMAAHLHAGLLALGLTPGLPAEWTTDADGRGCFVSPRGPELKITLRWKDSGGKIHNDNPRAWVVPCEKNSDMTLPETWIFIGSGILAGGRYWADCDGDVISLTNFQSAVIDVPIESSNKNALLNFKANPSAIPPLGTAVEVIIAPIAGAEKADFARAMLNLDKSGALQIDSKPITLKQLGNWARQFVDRHSRGRVIILAAPESKAHDIATVKQELELSNLGDIEVRHLYYSHSLLPKTDAEVDAAMKKWRKKFDIGQRLIIDPGQEADETLSRIKSQLSDLKRHSKILTQYAEKLSAAKARYQTTTAPAKP